MREIIRQPYLLKLSMKAEPPPRRLPDINFEKYLEDQTYVDAAIGLRKIYVPAYNESVDGQGLEEAWAWLLGAEEHGWKFFRERENSFGTTYVSQLPEVVNNNLYTLDTLVLIHTQINHLAPQDKTKVAAYSLENPDF